MCYMKASLNNMERKSVKCVEGFDSFERNKGRLCIYHEFVMTFEF